MIFGLRPRMARSCVITCVASSLVGAITSADPLESFMSFVTNGIPKAIVLPVPVCADPRISRPSSAGGIACACMGVGVVNSRSSRALLSASGSPNVLKFSICFVSFCFFCVRCYGACVVYVSSMFHTLMSHHATFHVLYFLSSLLFFDNGDLFYARYGRFMLWGVCTVILYSFANQRQSQRTCTFGKLCLPLGTTD